MAEKKVEKFLNFGPEWLHNLSQESCSAPQPAATGIQNETRIATIKCQLADHRYGREEMLALFDGNVNPPEVLTHQEELFVSRAQLPLALQAENTEDESSRRSWLARNPSPRTTPASAPVPRPALGKPMDMDPGHGYAGRGNRNREGYPEFPIGMSGRTRPYNPSYIKSAGEQPIPLGRVAFFPSGPPRRPGVNRESLESQGGRGMDRNGENEWDNSNRKEFNSGPGRWVHDGNWRRNMSRGPFIDNGWRGGSHIRPQFGKKLSWRDDEDREFRYDRDRSYAERDWGDKSDRNQERREKPVPWAANRKTWSGESHSPDDLLPEWANSENLLGPSGTFDSSGAFHGGNEDDKELESPKAQSAVIADIRSSLPRKPSHTKKYVPRPPARANSIGEVTKTSFSATDIDFVNKKVICNKIDELIAATSSTNIGENKLSGSDDKFPSEVPSSGSSDSEFHSNLSCIPPEPSDKDYEFTRQQMKYEEPNSPTLNRDIENEIDEEESDDLTHETTVDNSLVKENILVQSKFKGTEENEYPIIREIVKMLVQEEDSPDFKKGVGIDEQQNCVANPPITPNTVLTPPGVDVLPQITPVMDKQSLAPTMSYNSTTWFYMDPQGESQGPFTSVEMCEWFNTGYFSNNLLVRRATDIRFVVLGHWIQLCGMVPFLLPDADLIMSKRYGPTFVPPMLDPRLACDPMIQHRQQAMIINAAQQNYQLEMMHKEFLLKQRRQQQNIVMVNPGQPQLAQYPQPMPRTSVGCSIHPEYPMGGVNTWVPPTPPIFTWRDPSQPSNTPSPVQIPMAMPTSQGMSISNHDSPHQTCPANHQIAMPIPQLPSQPPVGLPGIRGMIPIVNQPIPYTTSHMPSSIWDIPTEPKQPILLEQLYSSMNQQHPSTLNNQTQNPRIAIDPIQPSNRQNLADMDVLFKNETCHTQPIVISSIGSFSSPQRLPPVSQGNNQQVNANAAQQSLASNLHLNQQNQADSDNCLLQQSASLARPGQNTANDYPYKFNLSDVLETMPTEISEARNKNPTLLNSTDFPKEQQNNCAPVVRPKDSEIIEASLELLRNPKRMTPRIEKKLMAIKQHETDESPKKDLHLKATKDEEIKNINLNNKIQKVDMELRRLRYEEEELKEKKKSESEKRKSEEEKNKLDLSKSKKKIAQPKDLQSAKESQQGKKAIADVDKDTSKKNKTVPAPKEQPQQRAAARTAPPAPWSAPKESSPDTGSSLSLFEIQKLEKEEKILQLKQMQEVQAQQEALAKTKDVVQLNTRNSMQLKWASQKPAQPSKVMSLAEIQAEEQLQTAKVIPKQTEKELSTSPVVSSNSGSIWGPPNVNHTWWQAPNGSSVGGIWDSAVVSQKSAETPAPPPSKQAPQQVTQKILNKTDNAKGAVAKQLTKKEEPKGAKNETVDEMVTWCMATLNAINSEIDVPAFISFLMSVEAPYEIKEYAKLYLGESKEATEFARQFLEKRSRMRNSTNIIPSDDLCSPAPAVNPSAADFQDAKGKGKRIRKNKMLKIDSRILGFNVSAAADRFNIGHIDSV